MKWNRNFFDKVIRMENKKKTLKYFYFKSFYWLIFTVGKYRWSRILRQNPTPTFSFIPFMAGNKGLVLFRCSWISIVSSSEPDQSAWFGSIWISNVYHRCFYKINSNMYRMYQWFCKNTEIFFLKILLDFLQIFLYFWKFSEIREKC